MEAREHDLPQRTLRYARAIVRCCRELPDGFIGWELGRQVLRSGTSIGANYREAMRARSTAEYQAKIGLCLGEASETEFWLELLDAEALIPSDRLVKLRQETSELIAILVTILKRSRGEG